MFSRIYFVHRKNSPFRKLTMAAGNLLSYYNSSQMDHLQFPFVADRNVFIDVNLVFLYKIGCKADFIVLTTICCGSIFVRDHNIWWYF